MEGKNILLRSPAQIDMIRTAISFPNSPREVGDGMETGNPDSRAKQPLIPLTTHPESKTSSGYSTPVLPISPRLSEKKLSIQMSPSQRSIIDQEETLSHRESLPSPTPSDPFLIKTEKFLMEEKLALKDHLRIQVQVNQELKRLLVASIGEDMGFHYERIATEKAQIEVENEELKRKLLAQEEETERLNISCDVWRSKFLASRVQCDESQETLIQLQRRQREMDTAVRALIREHRQRSEHLEELFDTLNHLHHALQRGKQDEKKKGEIDNVEGSIDEECLKLSHAVSTQLLGTSESVRPQISGYKKYLSSWKRVAPVAHTSSDLEYEINPTMAEKYVTQLLRETNANSTSGHPVSLDFHSVPSVLHTKLAMNVTGRFHLNVKHENITLVGCSKCIGDIHVV